MGVSQSTLKQRENKVKNTDNNGDNGEQSFENSIKNGTDAETR